MTANIKPAGSAGGSLIRKSSDLGQLPLLVRRARTNALKLDGDSAPRITALSLDEAKRGDVIGANFKSIGVLLLITRVFMRQNGFDAPIPTTFTKSREKSNFRQFPSSPVNAGYSRYSVVYIRLIRSIQAC